MGKIYCLDCYPRTKYIKRLMNLSVIFDPRTVLCQFIMKCPIRVGTVLRGIRAAGDLRGFKSNIFAFSLLVDRNMLQKAEIQSYKSFILGRLWSTSYYVCIFLSPITFIAAGRMLSCYLLLGCPVLCLATDINKRAR